MPQMAWSWPTIIPTPSPLDHLVNLFSAESEAHRLQDPSKWVPFGVGAIEGSSGGSLRVLEPGAERGEYGPGEEPRPREGEPTGSAHGELL